MLTSCCLDCPSPEDRGGFSGEAGRRTGPGRCAAVISSCCRGVAGLGEGFPPKLFDFLPADSDWAAPQPRTSRRPRPACNGRAQSPAAATRIVAIAKPIQPCWPWRAGRGPLSPFPESQGENCALQASARGSRHLLLRRSGQPQAAARAARSIAAQRARSIQPAAKSADRHGSTAQPRCGLGGAFQQLFDQGRRVRVAVSPGQPYGGSSLSPRSIQPKSLKAGFGAGRGR